MPNALTIEFQLWMMPVLFGAGFLTAITLGRVLARSWLHDYSAVKQALQQAESNYLAFYENAVEGIFRTTPSGQYLNVNPTFAKMHGYETPAAMVAAITDISTQTYTRSGDRAKFIQLLEQHGVVKEFEYPVYRRDGSIIWVSENARPVRDAAGQLLYYEGTVLDITDRKQAETALRMSEARLTKVVQHSFDIVQVLDRTFAIAYENPAFERILGYSSSPAAIEQTLSNIHPEDLPRVQPVMQAALAQSGVPIKAEYRIRRVDGAWVWLESVAINWLHDPDIRGIVVNSRDITNRKQMEEALQESEATNRAIINAIPDHLMRMERDGFYLGMIKSGDIKLLGADKIASGANIRDVLPPQMAQERMLYVKRALQTGELQKYEYQFEVDGEVRDEEARITVCGEDDVLVVVRDITDRVQAEQALRQSEATNRAILQAIPDLLVHCRFDGTYIDVIESLSTKTFAPRASLIGTNVLNNLPSDPAQKWVTFSARAVQTGKLQVYEQQVEIDGVLYDEEVRIVAINDDEILAIVRNISDRKQAEAALQQANSEMQAIFEAFPDLFFRVTQGGIILDYKTRSPQDLYTTPDQFLGQALGEVLPASISENLHSAIKQAVATNSVVNVEYSLPLSQGLEHFEARIVRLHSDQAIAVVRNISDRKRAERSLQQQAERDRALNEVTQAIRNSLDLNTIFSTTVYELANLLQADHVSLSRYSSEEEMWLVIASHNAEPTFPNTLGWEISDANNPIAAQLKRREIVRLDNVDERMVSVNRELADQFPGAWLIIPIDVKVLWGAITLMRHKPKAAWQDSEVELACAIANQLAIAIQQSQLYEEVQQLNTHLEQQVQQRTVDLQKALTFEALLKRITDKVRDSLDENQILQTAVDELGVVLEVQCCNAALYAADLKSHRINHEYSIGQSFGLGQEIRFSTCPMVAVFEQLIRGQHSQFCPLTDTYAQPAGELYAVLACPIFDDQGILGDLWLFKQKHESFNQPEIRLVQQVANQCAIALRQSRLYQAAQAQVHELERLNGLKDDFLSTVSHELRTPMSNIKMATQMLEIGMEELGALKPNKSEDDKSSDLSETRRISRYLQILKDECRRETALINDLLDLSRLDSGSEPLLPMRLNLQYWLPHVAETFADRIHNQQQQLVFDIPADLPTLETDFNYLELVLTELLHNACKYTPLGETIQIAARLVSSALPHATIEIRVGNSGVEIPEQELGHVFDKFYRVPNSDPWKHGGTGLGLALVKKRVVRLQGSIAVTSANNWTTFIILLPQTLRL